MDFASLVLGPAMAVFGQPVTVTPLQSQPGALAYPATAVFAEKAVTIPLEGGDGYHQTVQPELGIRLADYPVAPMQGDAVDMAQGSFVVFNVVLDGQGGATLVLRRTS